MMKNKSSIVSNVIWKFAERILAQLVSLIVSVVLARILLPEDYGIIAMVTVFITVANVFVTSGIPVALVQKQDADDLDFSSVFYFNLFLSVLIYMLLFLGAPYIAEFYDNSLLTPVIRVMGIRIIIASVNSVQHAYVSKNMLFKKYFWSTLWGTLISGIVGVGLAYCGWGVWALVFQYMVNTCVDTIVLLFTVSWRPKLLFSLTRVKELFGFGWKILIEGLSETITNEARNLIVGKVYSSADLAYYTKGQQFPNLIVQNIGVSISSVLFPAMSNIQDDENRVTYLMRKSIRLSCFLVFPLLFGLALVASPFVEIVLSEKWLCAVPYLQLFCIVQMFTVMFIPRHEALKSIGRSDVYMIEHIFYRFVSILLLLMVYKKSVIAITLSLIGSLLILLITVIYTSKKYNHYCYTDQLFDVLPTMICCMIMSCCVIPVNLLHLSSMICLLIQVALGCIVYFLSAILIAKEDVCNVWSLLKKFKIAKKLKGR